MPGLLARWGPGHVFGTTAVARLRSFALIMVTMVVDLDHLLADTVYDPDRCSIGFHPLHGPVPIAIYCILLLFPRSRLIGIGLLVHMALDGLDCL